MGRNKIISVAPILSIAFGGLGAFYTILGCLLCRSIEDPESVLTGQIFVLIGLCMLLAAFIIFLFHRSRKKKIEQLVENGRYVWCRVVNIIPNTSVNFNGQHPYIVVCEYTDHCDHTYRFKSSSLRFSPDRRIIGQQVRVFYQNENFRPYYVEISRLVPELAESE